MNAVRLAELELDQWIWSPKPGNMKRYQVLIIHDSAPYGVTVRAEGGRNRRMIPERDLSTWFVCDDQGDACETRTGRTT